jgi:hypothetical protein
MTSSSRDACCIWQLIIGMLLSLVCYAFIWPIVFNASSKGKPFSLKDNFTTGDLIHWQMPYPEDWEILTEGNMHYLHMVRPRPPGIPRRPLQFALLKNVHLDSFDLHVRVRRLGRRSSLIIVFNYVDTMHFYYVHLSADSSARIAFHNGIFIVNGAPRRRITGGDAPSALPDRSWHTVRIVRDVRSGQIRVFMDDKQHPIFNAVDHMFTCGQVGLGSFGNTGDFTQLRVSSKNVGCSPESGGK